jgi:prepilin-type N-terminal cleavage/methylation domain-containing protein
MKTRRNKRAFTLGEMVTTVAIVGIIAAVAIPNFLRIKMDVDTEMVRQNLRQFHQGVNDFLSNTGAFPSNVTGLGSSSEEKTITGSLTAIDQLGFDALYSVGPSGYQAIASPKTAKNGDRCFGVDLFGVRDQNCWDGLNLTINTGYGSFGGPNQLLFLNDDNLSPETKVNALAAHLEYAVSNYVLNATDPFILDMQEQGFIDPNETKGFSFRMDDAVLPAFKTFESLLQQKLLTRNIKVFYSDPVADTTDAGLLLYPEGNGRISNMTATASQEPAGGWQANADELSDKITEFGQTGEWPE